MKGGRVLIEAVLNHGVDTVFGLPGGQNYEVFDALYANPDRVRLVTSRHEQGVAYMAFGYARSTGKVGVYTVVPGPGVLNTTAALATAYATNSPVLCIAGQIPAAMIDRGIGFLHEIPDQLGHLQRLTKWARRADRPEDAAELVGAAFQALRGGRPRPVAIEMALDVMARECELTLPPPAPDVPPESIDPDSIARAAALLATARQPLIMVGGGAVGARAEVLELAEMLQAPVVSFRSGRGVVSDRHYLSQTFPAGHRLWPTADVVIAIGTRFKYPRMHWGTDAALKTVRIDIDAEEIERLAAPTVGIVADARAALLELIPALAAVNPSRASRRAELQTLKAEFEAKFATVQPQMDYLAAIRAELPDDGILVDEITQVGYASWYGFPVYAPRQLISSGYMGNLGYGYATALGVKIGNPDKAVVALSGDGGFLFTAAELATAVKYGIHVVAIVFRDDAFTNVARAQQLRYGGRVIGTDLANPDFAKLAEVFGAIGDQARNPAELRAALRRGLAAKGPVIIEVPIGQTANPWDFLLLPRVRPA